MTTDPHNCNKSRLTPFNAALYDGDLRSLEIVIANLFAKDAVIQWTHPFECISGPNAIVSEIYQPLTQAIPDLERRDFFLVGGNADGCDWVGCGGYYTGFMTGDWLDIPAPRQQVHMRFHEFYRFDGGQIVETQAVWDIPELIKQAGVWPMAPSLGLEWHVPGPASQDGLVPAPYDQQKSAASLRLVGDMLSALTKSPKGGAAMQLDKYWHPKMNWYGPSGIGTGRHISGFRHMHQIPFLKAMPDRGTDPNGKRYLFADGNYVAVTGWPNMRMTLSSDGWLGLAPADQKLTMRSLDFWRCENGLIRENWVLIDMLHVYHQLGIDVFNRMREMRRDARSDYCP